MRILKVDPNAPDSMTLTEAASILARGGLVAYPTDTLYGLAVDPRNDDAVERLYRAKGRDASVAVPLIAGSLEQAFAAGDIHRCRRAARASVLAWATVDRRAGVARSSPHDCSVTA